MSFMWWALLQEKEFTLKDLSQNRPLMHQHTYWLTSFWTFPICDQYLWTFHEYLLKLSLSFLRLHEYTLIILVHYFLMGSVLTLTEHKEMNNFLLPQTSVTLDLLYASDPGASVLTGPCCCSFYSQMDELWIKVYHWSFLLFRYFRHVGRFIFLHAVILQLDNLEFTFVWF